MKKKIKFECDDILPWYDYANSPWGENREFAYHLVKNVKPRVIVELGSYLGCSTFAFAQSCKDNSIECMINAIDTWEGDVHSGFYDSGVFESFKRAQTAYTDDVDFTIMQMEFDKARRHYTQEDIDILHIDGLHTYEAVKHDFENWSPLVKDDGIILLHDINVKKEGFGVWRFWDERKSRKDYKFDQIQNTNGLGIINKSAKREKQIIDSLVESGDINLPLD